MGATFISFLGVSDYRPVRYSISDTIYEPTPYIQVAVAAAYQALLEEEGSTIKVFMTGKARQVHWERSGGLYDSLRIACPGSSPEAVEIPELTDEKELWTIFDLIYAHIPPEGNVLFDITHGYRSMPLLGAVILDYARTLKRIKILSIHYAAIEACKDEVVPVVDLTRLDRLFRWNRACELYVRRGDASGLEGLMGETAKASFKTIGPSATVSAERGLVSLLKESYGLLETVRGEEIIDGMAFIKAARIIDSIRKTEGIARPMIPLYDLMIERLSKFRTGHMANLFFAVDLCLKFGLVQQGITLLQESLISVLLRRENLDINRLFLRTAVSRYLSFLSRPDAYRDPEEDPELLEISSRLGKNPLCTALVDDFERLRDCRNNINHAGFTSDGYKAERFRTRLKDTFHSVLSILVQDSQFRCLESIIEREAHEN